MGLLVRRSLLSALSLALAGVAAFAMFVRGVDSTHRPVSRMAATRAPQAPSPARADAAAGAREDGAGPGAAGAAGVAASAGPGSPAPHTAEDWRTSPRLWLFSAEDRDRVQGLLDAFAIAAREADWRTLDRISKEFGTFGARAVAPLLDVLLRDSDDRMRIYAAALLGEIQETVPGGILREALRAHALPLLEEVASTAEDSSMRHSALVALGKIGDPASLDFLADAVRRSEGWPMVPDAIRALGSIRGARATAEIADLAGREPDPRVRERLARAMGEREDPAALGALEDLATRDNDPAVRAAAAEALGRLGTPAAERALRDIAGGQDEPAVRAAAVQALGRAEHPGVVDTLRRVLRSEDDPEVRSAAWRGLREMGTPEARQAIAPYPPAVRVGGVVPGTQADRLSLSANDVITSYAGKHVPDAGTLRKLVLSTPPEEVVPLVVDRGGWTTTHQVHGGLLGVQVEDGAVLD